MKRVYPAEEFCVACRLCEVYCATEHSQSRDVIRAFKEEQPPPTKRIFLQQEGAASLAINCRHCDEPRCVWACVAGALTKDPVTGVVNYQPEKCIGCWTCLVACPYGVIVRDPNRPKIAKCDLCPGRDVPVCVAVCPNRALVLS
ncbi:MAG: 4Fe-4S dicluster domain-containing protein [Chloroflexi bacterium]|nr:4Fe-4S dicluster domain-containing protein [Chloroflexota bacterium]